MHYDAAGEQHDKESVAGEDVRPVFEGEQEASDREEGDQDNTGP